MIEVITRECKKTGNKTRVSLASLIEVMDGKYEDPMLALLEAARGNMPIESPLAIYRIERFGVNENLPRY